MSTLDAVLGWLVEHGATLCLGSTVVLALGVLAVRSCRSPVHRRRLGMLTVLATLGYLVAAAPPLPRLLPAHDPLAPVPVATPALATPSPASLPAPAAPRAPDAAAAPMPAPLPAAERAAAIERALAQLDGEILRATAATPPRQASPLAPAPAAWSWQNVLALAYLAGVALALLRLAAGSTRLGVLLASCRPVQPASVRGAHLPRRVRLLATARDVRPFCTGVLRPSIVLPRSLLAPSRHAEALAVIRHEAAHLQNGDPFAQALLALLAVPLFWHPLLWWLARDVRFHGELLADDAAAGACRTDYARALLQLAERAQPELRAAGTVAVFHRPSEFFRRIQMLLQREGALSTSISRRQRAGHALAALALVATTAGVLGVDAPAQEPKPSPAREAELRNTIDTLRNDISTLRAELETLRAARNSLPGTPLAPPLENKFHDYGTDFWRAHGMHPTQSESRRFYGSGNLRGVETTPQPDASGLFQPAPQADLSDVLGTPRPGANGQPVAPPPAQPPGASPYAAQPRPGIPTPAVPSTPYPAPGYAPGGTPPVDDFYGGGAFPPVADPASPFGAGPVGGADGRSTAATVDLASRYIDLVAELELAEEAAEEQKRLADAGVAPKHEARRAQVNLRTLKRKLAVVDKLLNGEIAATQAEIACLAEEQQRAAPPDRGRIAVQMQRATMRLEAMRSVR